MTDETRKTQRWKQINILISEVTKSVADTGNRGHRIAQNPRGFSTPNPPKGVVHYGRFSVPMSSSLEAISHPSSDAPDVRRPKVLFLCTANSCRSQMAEAVTRSIFGRQIEAFSAGVRPAPSVNRIAIDVLQEIHVSTDGLYPKQARELSTIAFDLVVTVCSNAAEDCPFFPGCKRQEHVGFDDPPVVAGEPTADELAVYRRVRDEIVAFIRGSLPTLLAIEPVLDGELL